MECQGFRQGCCGCCVNRRWAPERLTDYVSANTRAAEAAWGGGRPRWRDLVRVHLARGGWRDHLLAVWLVPLTFGASAWLWRCRYGSCCFAGYLDRAAGRKNQPSPSPCVRIITQFQKNPVIRKAGIHDCGVSQRRTCGIVPRVVPGQKTARSPVCHNKKFRVRRECTPQT